MKKVVILGLGISGKDVAAYWLQRGAKVIGVDRKAIEVEGVEVRSDLGELEGVDLVVVSPGVPWSHPWVQKARGAGIEVVGEAQFALKQVQNRCVAITGTNGKTTMVRLVEHVLKSCGRKARAVGNVGASLTGYLQGVDPEEILIVELSSYQLEDLSHRCFEAAAILNITPDHLDRYVSMEAYARAKVQVQECVLPGGKLFVSEQVVREYRALLKEWICVEDIAWALCSHLGVSKEAFQRGVETFQRPLHRIEWVAEIEGIAYYNDSKATNIDAVVYAVKQLQGRLILLVGGVDKGASYAPWREAFRGKVKQLFAFGPAASLMEKELADAFVFQRVASLEEALQRAYSEAERGDTVLLSPGCASFDAFRNYEHRGEEFKKMVKSWIEKRRSSLPL